MLLRVLGSFEAEDGGGEPLDLGGPRQRAVLAMLFAAGGRAVSAERLIDGLWRGDAPDRAVVSLQAYVSNLRRVLEPDRPRRAPARLLVTATPGYALRLPAETVDAGRFEAAQAVARGLAADDPLRARQVLTEALALWRGPALGEFAGEPWARAEVARLEEKRLAAWELLLDVTLRTGDAAEVVPEAELLTGQAPRREEGWRLLTLALWRAGRQADALAALRRARAYLAEEHGLDPGPALVELESAILAQDAIRLDPSAGLFVGRDIEVAALRAAARAAEAGRRQIVLLTGEAGAGKTTMLDHVRRDLTVRGWQVVLGRCPEDEGSPPAWAWVEALRGLAGQTPPGDRAADVAPLLGDVPQLPGDVAAGRFRLHRAVAAWVGEAAARRPLAVLLDDLHLADSETLRLLAAISEVPLLFVLALRPRENPERLAPVLGVLARRDPHRLHLGGLAEADVGRIVAAFAGTQVDPKVVGALTDRTGGNPFYVRELARLFAAEGALVATSEVPEGVRDVLRRSLRQFGEPALGVLRLAAVAGREADVAVLTGASDLREDAVLNALETAVTAGLLAEPAPGRVRFVHVLVRDTLYADIPRLRQARTHARIADSIRRLWPDDHSALAHHYARAGSAATASRAVTHAIRAAELAESRYAYDAAIDLLSAAAERAGPAATRIDLLGRLLRAQARAGATDAGRRTRSRAIELAAAAGRDDLMIAALTAWRVPSPWSIRRYGEVDQQVVDVLTRLLGRAGLGPVDRCRLLEALVNELEGEPDPRAEPAGREALAISRAMDDPELRALGLAARLMTLRYDREAPIRRELARELGDLAGELNSATYGWFAEQVRGHAAAVLNDPATVRASVTRQETMARRYQLNEALAINLGSQGALAHVAGDFATAGWRYGESVELMRRQGSLHADAFEFFTTATVLISQGRLGEHVEASRIARKALGPLVDDLLALALIADGRPGEARAVPWGSYACRPDYFQSGLLTFRAMVVVAFRRTDLAAPLIEALRPVRDQLAGFSTTAIVTRPVALTLGELFRLCGAEPAAAEHFALAASVARRWEAPHWQAEVLSKSSPSGA
jgi:DNA-binding SARP family transcriptional activator